DGDVDRQRHRGDRGRRRGAAHGDGPHARRVRGGVLGGVARRRAVDGRRQGRSRRPRGVRHRPGAAGESIRVSEMAATTLTRLVEDLAAGRVAIVDLTQPLGPATPVIGLPPIFAPSPGVTIDVISRYDDKGPAWYWNTLRLGEHTGTHFDAPVHWVTGKDLPSGACDTIPAGRFVGPACVIDVERDVAADPDFLLKPARIEQWEAVHRR